MAEFTKLKTKSHIVQNQMVIVAQLVRASDCGSEGRGFETRLSPKSPEVIQGFFCIHYYRIPF
jgi:hypothetical protein